MCPLPLRSKKNGGFALVIALSLMAFVLLLLLSITTLVRVETRASVASTNRIEAQQNALMAARVALGQLQRYAGADQRVTARADVIGATNSKRQYTGVWDTSLANPSANVVWLASDWEEGMLSYTNDAAPASTEDGVVTLIGDGTVDSDDSINAVRVIKTDIEGADGNPAGSFAWWVGDENTKANIRPQSSLAASGGDQISERYDSILSLGNKRQADLGVIGEFAGDTIDANLLQRVMSPAQMELVGFNEAGLRSQFHNYTLNSYGVLSNTRDGGLKKDLSIAFELDDSQFDTSEFAAAGDAPVSVLGTAIEAQPIFYDNNGGRGPSWHLLRDYYTIYQRMQNPLTDPVFPAQHFLPNHDELGFPPSIKGLDWRELAAMRFDNAGIWSSNPDGDGDPLLSDLMPYLIRATYGPYTQRWGQLQGLRFSPVAPPEGSDDSGFDYVTPNILLNSFAVYHNPYNVKLEHYGLMTVINHVRFNLLLRSLLDESVINAPMPANRTTFKVAPGIMEPGVANVYHGLGLDQGGFSEPGTPIATDFYNPGEFTGIISGGLVAVPVESGPGPGQSDERGNNLEVDFAPFNSHVSGSTQRWPIWIYHSMGSSTRRVSQNLNSEDLARSLYSYAGYNEEGSIVQTDRDHRAWLNNPGEFSAASNSYNVDRNTTFLNTLDYMGQTAPLPYMMVDNYLVPTDDNYAFPVFALSNPLAPMMGTTNLLNSDGPPVFAPSWRLTISKANVAGGAAVIESAGGEAYWGSSNSAVGTRRTAPLELPVVPPTSIGQLQSANLSTLGTMPALAVGNSFATPYLARDQISGVFKNYRGADRLYHDLSYYLNDELWDKYFFSSYSVPYDKDADDFDPVANPAGISFDAAFDPGFSNRSLLSGSLPNPRMKLLLNQLEDLGEVKAKIFDGSNRPLPTGVDRTAENLMVEGAFNVNSTSVDAWAAVLAAGRGNPMHLSTTRNADSIDAGDIGLSRFVLPSQGAFTQDINDDTAWSGYRTLSVAQIRLLAENIVAELKARVAARGYPFESLGEFVNRKLSNDAFGLSGLIQAAIDRADLNSDFERDNADFSLFPETNNVRKADSENRAAAIGAAAHINQADVLQAIGSFIQVRSDTFCIRAYGDSRDPVTNEVIGRAWCEMVVQRIPEPVYPALGDPTDDPRKYWEPDLNEPDMGRRFKVISVRFLDEESV